MNVKNSMKLAFGLSLIMTMSCTKSCGKGDMAGQKPLAVYFENLKDNDEIVSPVTVSFGVRGMTVRPALEDVNDKTSGHHHILIDHPTGYIEKGQAIPADARHIHFGKGETQATIELSPGKHTLALQFADGAHISYGRDMAAMITVRVVEKAVDVEDAPTDLP